MSTSNKSDQPSNPDSIVPRLDRIETKLESLLQLANLLHQESPKEFYTTAEVAKMFDRAEWTVREWCRLGRILAEKRECGRGVSKEWMISHDEIQRYRNEGLLPL